MGAYMFAEKPAAAGAPMLFVFHGTGGSETQFLDVGATVWPEAHIIAVRGDVMEGNALRYFKRRVEGVFDMDDLERATGKLRDFIASHVARRKPSVVAALGYSNGANIIASVLFSHPELIDKAVLMHPLIPFAPSPQPGLKGTDVLITAGRRDPMVAPTLTEALEGYLRAQGAMAETVWHDGGHELRPTEMAAARDFLSR